MACPLQSPSSKHPLLSSEVKHQNDIDHISNLPDSVLCHILSFLPTEDAVATTILSKRWVDLWTQVPVLVFTFPYHYVRNGSSLVNFVFNVLLMLKAQSTCKFSLDWRFNSVLDVGFLRTWINTAVRRNVQELSLNYLCPGRYVDLFECPFACKSLVSLKLSSNILVDVPAKIHLPCLRILELKRVKYANDDTLRRLICSCPVLEDLAVLRKEGGDNIGALDFNVPSVKRITVVGGSSQFYTDLSCKLLIKAPLLERINLMVELEGYSEFLMEDASNLAEAIILVYGKLLCEGHFIKLLKGIANVRSLCLGCSTIWSVCPPKAKFPMFHNLVCLNIHCCCEYWQGLLALLECSDNLEQLVYDSVHMHKRKCDQALVGSVPKCVSMRLKSFYFRDISANHCDWTFLRCFLTNGKFLKQVKIGISFCLKKRRRLLRNLLKYPRASMACEIGFFLESTKEEIHLGPNNV